jgi:hypothetical protein
MRGIHARRSAAAATLAVVVALAFTGCAATNGLAGDASAAFAAHVLADKLETFTAVTSASAVYNPLASLGRSLTVKVRIRKGTSGAAWANVAQAASAGMRGKEFAGVTGTAALSSADGAKVSLSTVKAQGKAALRAELTRWRALEVAAGVPLELELAPGGADSTSGHPVTYQVPSGDHAATLAVLTRWPRIAAVPGATTADSTWIGPGFEFYGGSPPASIISLTLTALHALAPLDQARSTSKDRVAVSWTAVNYNVQLWSSARGHPDAIGPVASRIIALAADGPRGTAASWNGAVYGGSFVVSGCLTGYTRHATADDKALVAAIRAAGHGIPKVLPGSCQQ